MAKSHFIEAASACLSNGKRLLEDAEMLEYDDPPSTSFALATIAQEEFAKGFLLFLVSRDTIPWNPLVNRASRDHTCKQLLGIVMSHMNPDTDEFLRRMDEWRAMNKEASSLLDALGAARNPEEQGKLWERLNAIDRSQEVLPPTVADAIYILRHEKIGRWQSWFCWEEEPNYDRSAMQVANGQLDREKQDSLYVRLNTKGEVVGIPTGINPEIAKQARERANRLGRLVGGLLAGDAGFLFDYEKVESAFRALFASLAEKSDAKAEGD
jgi:AbiV family abortive infection protein